MGWMSNCSEVLDAVAVECSSRNKPAAQHHRHVQLIGRASATERYPPRLIKAILRGLRKHLQTVQAPAKALAACMAPHSRHWWVAHRREHSRASPQLPHRRKRTSLPLRQKRAAPLRQPRAAPRKTRGARRGQHRAGGGQTHTADGYEPQDLPLRAGRRSDCRRT